MDSQHNDEIIKEDQDENFHQSNKFNRSKIKKFSTFFILILTIGIGTTVVICSCKGSKTKSITKEKINHSDQSSNHVNKKRFARSWNSEHYPDMDRGYLNYVRPSTLDDSSESFEPVRVPYVRYQSDYPFNTDHWKQYSSHPNMYADTRNHQSFIHGRSGIFVVPQVYDKYDESYSMAELISDGYATFENEGASLPVDFEIENYIYPPRRSIDRHMPRFDYNTGCFQGGIHTDFCLPIESDHDENDDHPHHQYGSNERYPHHQYDSNERHQYDSNEHHQFDPSNPFNYPHPYPPSNDVTRVRPSRTRTTGAPAIPTGLQFNRVNINNNENNAIRSDGIFSNYEASNVIVDDSISALNDVGNLADDDSISRTGGDSISSAGGVGRNMFAAARIMPADAELESVQPVCDPPCGNNGTCVDLNTCHCTSSYTGPTCSTPVCDPECENNGTCQSPNRCSCTYSYTGPACATPVCKPNCENGGTCIAPDTCSCISLYTGPRCTIPICKAGCENGGTCVAPDTCSCTLSYSGSTCTTPVCNPRCENNGVCIAPNTCNCTSSYDGPTCSTPICNIPCNNNGTCVAPDTCGCKQDFTGATCSIPISVFPTQCANYITITDGTRNVANIDNVYQCDNTTFNSTVQWVRFSGAAGTQIITSAVPMNQCGTEATGWFQGVVPNAGHRNWGSVCYHYMANECASSNHISITNCDGFYVYGLREPPICNARYCTV